jgi:hypothetical protein
MVKGQFSNGMALEYTIFDATGRLNLAGNISSNNSTIDVSALRAGIYVLTLNISEKSYTFRFAKR